jgi:hypothetical protein
MKHDERMLRVAISNDVRRIFTYHISQKSNFEEFFATKLFTARHWVLPYVP